MKRCVLVDSYVSTSKKDNATFLNLVCYKLASKMKDGKLYHPMKSDAIVTVFVNKENNKDNFDKYSKYLPGTLLDVEFYVNEFNGKTCVRILDVVDGTVNVFSEDKLFV